MFTNSVSLCRRSRPLLPFLFVLFASSAAAQPPANDPALITRVNGSEQGFVLFQERCMTCHGRADMPQAPSPDTLRRMPARRIYEALTTGAMQVHAEDLDERDIRFVAEAVSGELLADAADGDASNMPNQCAADSFPSAINRAGPVWNGWSPDRSNSRHQDATNAGLDADQVPDLNLLWAFGFPGGVSAYGQPSVVGDRVFVGADNGYVYSLDAATGCVHWSFRAAAGVRTSISIGRLPGQDGTSHAAYFGDMKANLYAVDATSGRLLWQTEGDSHIAARITASPALHEGVLYVPMSAWEEGAARAESYPCCTFRGSVAAYDANTGERLWKTHTITEAPQPTRKNSAGTQLHAPAGATVWNTPVIDPRANALYFGTGNSYTWPAAETSDSVMALDLDSGEVRWHYQVYENDAFLVGCGAVESDNCPEQLGPDRDIPAPPILVERDGGQRLLLVATRLGELLAFDPDRNGHLLWRIDMAQVEGSGTIWGGTSDGEKAYYGLNSGGVVAVDLERAETAWFSPIGVGSNGAAASSIDGVAFIGAISGVLSALSTEDGEVLWQFRTDREFDTVNGVPANGGSISAAGTVIAGGHVFATSGYQVIFGNPGNVLLAFAPAQTASDNRD